MSQRGPLPSSEASVLMSICSDEHLLSAHATAICTWYCYLRIIAICALLLFAHAIRAGFLPSGNATRPASLRRLSPGRLSPAVGIRLAFSARIFNSYLTELSPDR